jgi:hypothetical protein
LLRLFSFLFLFLFYYFLFYFIIIFILFYFIFIFIFILFYYYFYYYFIIMIFYFLFFKYFVSSFLLPFLSLQLTQLHARSYDSHNYHAPHHIPFLIIQLEIQDTDKSQFDTELDELVKISAELKRQKHTFDTSPKKSSIQMRTLSESIRKLAANLARHSVFLQQVLLFLLLSFFSFSFLFSPFFSSLFSLFSPFFLPFLPFFSLSFLFLPSFSPFLLPFFSLILNASQ